MTTAAERDHGGGIDAASRRFGGARGAWLDLSTGINPVPYPLPELDRDAWTALPDRAASDALEAAARRFWRIPGAAAVLAAPGASALIARIPALMPPATAHIPKPTYNEHAGAFQQEGWTLTGPCAAAQVVVHPNNPDGRLWQADELAPVPLRIIDGSSCDRCPERSLIRLAAEPGTIILKSFGKFWGLAGLRLGFAIGDPRLLDRLAQMLGPWPVAGPALSVGRAALDDPEWASAARRRLDDDARRLDGLLTRRAGATLVGGTTLFRLYAVADAEALRDRLAASWIWTRIFPYSDRWIRFGLPGTPADWDRLEAAL